ncbi:hypothetical protein AJ78_06716 [Emergomyces pasteurianus Ep9510]|uniref:Uncharacterized protein n=1 Tax=Emergomyces pasteurianus Ep9510 TaxID=1447872 RepID=A0A1J9P9X1_9EURO|nr:hypothetical protein AJ78_06716 [Emergomyces pasteurianus Ep9510]
MPDAEIFHFIEKSGAVRPSEILEAAGVRWCFVGDLVVARYYPLMPSDYHVAIADEQLETARAALASHGFQELPQTHIRLFDRRATKESKTGWPGYRFLPNGADEWGTCSTIIMPATFWHLDLSPNSWETNTYFVTNTPCRFPQKLLYFRCEFSDPYQNVDKHVETKNAVVVIIDIVADRYVDGQLNDAITGYFLIQYSCLLVFARDVISSLSSEDQFFVELFDKVILRSAKEKVCFQRQRIRAGSITPEAAKALIPRKDLEVAAIKRKYQALAANSQSNNDNVENRELITQSHNS